MLKNYLKSIFRNIRRNRSFTAINVVGLSLGLAAFIAIAEYVRFEKSFDNYHPQAEDIVRIGIDVNFGDGDLSLAYMGAPGAKLISADFPQVEEATRLYLGFRRDYFVKVGEKEFKEAPLTRMAADKNFFAFWGITLLQGNPIEVLAGPQKVVLTATTAERYFGADWAKQSLIGKSIELNDELILQISGICEDVPDNTHFSFNLLVSMDTYEEAQDNLFFVNAFYHYFRLQKDTDRAAFLAGLNGKAGDYLNGDIQQFLGKSYSDFFADDSRFFNFFYQPVSDIHLTSDYELEIEENGDRAYVDIFTGVAVLVLLMAAINFMNLSMVTGLKRYKEVGIRKVLGAVRGQVIFQFLLESVIIVLFSLIFAITIIQILAPSVNAYFGVELIRPFSALVSTLISLIAGAVVLGILSGFYPAWSLSGINPGISLKGTHHRSNKAGLFRNTLIVFQFAISLLLIIGVWGIHSQLKHMGSQDLGYDKEQVMIVEDSHVLGDRVEAFRASLVNNASILSATISGFVPIGSLEYGTVGYELADGSRDFTFRINYAEIDEHYLETYGLELIAGRNYSLEFGNEKNKVIVTESFLKPWGWSAEEAIGKQLRSVGDKEVNTIIGVVNDFQVLSMKSKGDPFALVYAIDNQRVALKVSVEDWTQIKATVQNTWAEFTDKPFQYSMADAMFENTFEQERKVSELFTAFSLLALFIGSLGLLGVASFVIVQRSKEVGIRKILGASISELFRELSKSFVKLILIAGLIAIPVAYFFLGDWLNQYAYQVGLSWWLFVIPFIFVALIALSIIAMQIWKVAIINPIQSLRHE